jgi:hypothetical protein
MYIRNITELFGWLLWSCLRTSVFRKAAKRHVYISCHFTRRNAENCVGWWFVHEPASIGGRCWGGGGWRDGVRMSNLGMDTPVNRAALSLALLVRITSAYVPDWDHILLRGMSLIQAVRGSDVSRRPFAMHSHLSIADMFSSGPLWGWTLLLI